MAYLHDLLWALVGLLLTIGGTLVEGFIINIPANFTINNIAPQSLGVTCQIGAVLLIGCLGGKNAAILSQIAYLIIGLTFLPVFALGGGLGYVFEPSFGYLLGFIPGSWVCGLLAFRRNKLTLEDLSFSCLIGLIIIHLFGIIHLIILSLLGLLNTEIMTLKQSIIAYSLMVLPGQLILICAVTLTAFIFRKIMLY